MDILGRRAILLLLGITQVVHSQTAAGPASSSPSNPTDVSQHQDRTIVTGTYTPIPLNEADRTVRLISIDESSSVFRNVMDALQSEPSIDLRQRAPGIQGDLSIRGSSFGQTLVMVDGLRLNDAQTAHNNLDLPFPFAAVKQIEVLEGSGSTLYGADALGGAVNFITAPATATELRLGASGGSFGTNGQTGSLAWVYEPFTERISFTRELSTGFVENRDYRTMSFGSESTWRSGLGLTDILLGYSDHPFGAAGFYGDYPSWERTKGWFAGFQQALGEDTDASFGFRRHTDLFDLFRYQPWIYQNDHITESWQAALRRHQAIRHNIRIYYGLEGYRDSINSNNLGQHVRDRGAGYAGFDARALRRFSINAGVREEYFTGGHTVFTPSISGGYWLTSRLKLHAAASTAFRLPTFTDLYYSDPANIGNPNLRPERARSYEGGLRLALGRFMGDVTVFRRHDENDIDYIRDNAQSVWQAANIQNLNFTGVTASLNLQIAPSQRIDIAYTGLHGAQSALNGEQSKYIFEYPVQSAAVNWWGHTRPHVDLHVRVGVLDRYARDPYPLIELSASRPFPHVRPYIQLSNLTNTAYEEIPGVPMPGRSYLAGIEFVATKKAK